MRGNGEELKEEKRGVREDGAGAEKTDSGEMEKDSYWTREM